MDKCKYGYNTNQFNILFNAAILDWHSFKSLLDKFSYIL